MDFPSAAAYPAEILGGQKGELHFFHRLRCLKHPECWWCWWAAQVSISYRNTIDNSGYSTYLSAFRYRFRLFFLQNLVRGSSLSNRTNLQHLLQTERIWKAYLFLKATTSYPAIPLYSPKKLCLFYQDQIGAKERTGSVSPSLVFWPKQRDVKVFCWRQHPVEQRSADPNRISQQW